MSMEKLYKTLIKRKWWYAEHPVLMTQGLQLSEKAILCVLFEEFSV